MEAYIERMVEEKRELDGRISRLIAFFYSDKGDDLDDKQKYLLDSQFRAMTKYHETLVERIKYEKIKTGVIPDPDAGKADKPMERASNICCSPQ